MVLIVLSMACFYMDHWGKGGAASERRGTYGINEWSHELNWFGCCLFVAITVCQHNEVILSPQLHSYLLVAELSSKTSSSAPPIIIQPRSTDDEDDENEEPVVGKFWTRLTLQLPSLQTPPYQIQQKLLGCPSRNGSRSRKAFPVSASLTFPSNIFWEVKMLKLNCMITYASWLESRWWAWFISWLRMLDDILIF